MSVKIRLQRKGRRKRPFYHIVIADARAPRDGKFIEQIGSYNPMTSPATIEIDDSRVLYWMEQGAQPTDTVRAVLRFKGILYRRHLDRGVAKGAFTQDVADKMFEDFMSAKNDRIAKRIEDQANAKVERNKQISGVAPILEVKTEEVEAEADASETAGVDAEVVAEAATEESLEERVEEVIAETAAAVEAEADAARAEAEASKEEE